MLYCCALKRRLQISFVLLNFGYLQITVPHILEQNITFSYYYFYMFLEIIYDMLLYRYERAGNEQFVTETSKWVFHERGHLKVILPYFSIVIL
jgi:hypothetical protein